MKEGKEILHSLTIRMSHMEARMTRTEKLVEREMASMFSKLTDIENYLHVNRSAILRNCEYIDTLYKRTNWKNVWQQNKASKK